MKTRRRISRRARRLGRWLTWSLAGSLGLATGVFGWSQLVNQVVPDRARVTSVEISGSRRVPPAELARLSGLSAGTPLGAVDPAEIEARIRSHPWVAQARVTALPPGRLLIGVEERTPRAVARLGDTLYYVDGSGVAFAEALAEGGIPELVGAVEVRRGEPHTDLVAGIQVLDALARERLPAPLRVEIGADPDGERPAFEWRRGDAIQRVVLGEGEPAGKLARLARLIRADLREARDSAQLDLRFAERVVLRPAAPGEAAGTPSGGEGSEEDRVAGDRPAGSKSAARGA